MAKNQAELLNLPDLSEIDNIELVSLIGQKTNTNRFAILTQILNEWMIDYKIQILYLEPVKEANIIIPSVDKNEKIVLAAHYDVFPESYGYIDNACAVACLILLKKRGMLPDNVEILLCDCEECGQYGSSRYCEMYHEQIKAVINLDVIGYGEVLYYMHNNPIFESIATKHSMKPAKFPPCDYDSFKNLNMPTLSLSTGDGPDWDTTYPKLISLLHNNRNDNNINMVNSDSMTLVINTLEQILQNGTLNKLKTTAR